MTKTGRNDPCPCGSGKKYKKCHGAGSDGVTLRVKGLDPELSALGDQILGALDDLASSMKVDRENRDERFFRICAYHHALRVHGIARASLILARGGSRWLIFALRRVIFEYWVKGLYFEKHPKEAVLFVASVPLIQRRFAEKWAKCDGSKDFSGQFKVYNEIVDAMIQEYPDLRQPRKGSVGGDDDETKDWEPERVLRLAIKQFNEEAKTHPELIKYCRDRYQLEDSVTDEAAMKVFAEEKYLMNSEYPSQEIHDTALSLVPTLGLQKDSGFERFSDHFEDPDPLVWGCLGFAIGMTQMVSRVSGIKTDRTAPLQKSLDEVGHRLGID